MEPAVTFCCKTVTCHLCLTTAKIHRDICPACRHDHPYLIPVSIKGAAALVQSIRESLPDPPPAVAAAAVVINNIPIAIDLDDSLPEINFH